MAGINGIRVEQNQAIDFSLRRGFLPGPHFTDEKEIQKIVDHIKAQGRPEYDTTITRTEEELDDSDDLPGRPDGPADAQAPTLKPVGDRHAVSCFLYE